MFTSDEEEKKYIPPDYSNDPEDDEDDDDDDDISEDDDGEIENYLDNQEQLNKKTMTTTPFNSTPGWGTNNNSSSPWSTGTQQSPWGQTQSSPWSKPNTPSWGSNTPGWGTNNGTSWGGTNNWNSNNQSGKKEIDRQKKVIFCDVLDCLVETFQSSGKPGLLPRGIYDIRLRFEVWDKIACFNPTRVYAMVPRCLLLSSNGSESWKIMLNYIICSLSEYLRVPFYNCQILVQSTIDQSKEDMIRPIIESNFISKKEIIQIGLNSGLYGQNNKDQFAAQCCGIDYVDLGQLLNSYY